MAVVRVEFWDMDRVEHRVWWDTEKNRIGCSCGRQHHAQDNKVCLGWGNCSCGRIHPVYLRPDGKLNHDPCWYESGVILQPSWYVGDPIR